MFELVQNNPLLITLNIVMLIAMWYTMRPAIRYADGEVSSGRLYFTLFMWFAFDVFSFWGSDWFHLYVRYKEIMAGHPTVEYIYTWIAFHLAPFNYILFRIIVWGSAQLLLWDAFKRLSVSSHLVLAVFVTVWMIWFSFGRVSLAMALVFWGLTYYYKPGNIPLLHKVIGILAILLSFYFHKSSIFLIFVAFLTILTNKITRMGFVLSFIALPALVYMLNKEYIDIILSSMTDKIHDLDAYVMKAQYYMETEEKENTGIGPLIGILLEKIPFYVISALGLVAIFNDKGNQEYEAYAEIEEAEAEDGETSMGYDEEEEEAEVATGIPEDIKVYIRILFFIVFFSSFFLLNIAMNTQVLYDRLIKFSLVPATVIVAYLLENQKYVRYAWWTYCLALLGTCYQMIYMLYCSITNAK